MWVLFNNDTNSYGYIHEACSKSIEIKNAFRKIEVSKVGDRSRGRPEGSLFNSYYTEVYRRALSFSLDCSTLPSIRTLYRWVLSKEESITIFKVFGMTQPGIETRSPGPLANTLLTRLMSWYLKVVGDHSRGRPEGFLFNSYYTEM